MYERRVDAIASRKRFTVRMARHLAAALAFVAFSLFIGMAGYVYFEQLSWLDAFVDASMLLGGMGPVHTPETPGGKLFAGLYALYSGLVFLVTAGVLLAPLLHRALHKFHWRDDSTR
jgi:hypothetical protein